MSYIIHEPLIKPDLSVLGYKLSWHPADSGAADEADLHGMLLATAESLVSIDNKWLLHERLLFLKILPHLLSADSLKSFPPDKTVLSIDASFLEDEDAWAAAVEFRRLGFGLSIVNQANASIENERMALVTHLEIDCSSLAPDAVKQIDRFRQMLPGTRILGRNVNTWDEYATCKTCGLDAFAGNFYLQISPSDEKKPLNPTQSIILKGLSLLNRNADVGLIEKELKRDPAITYKLLRYINAAGFGARTDISSLRQAVNYLGYSNLNKWLCFTLAMSSTIANASVLLETAMMRGIFMETLGRKRLSQNEADQLFITGIFSLLDRLLDMPTTEVLKEIHLSEMVQDALLDRSGIFGRYLSLAEACEHRNGFISLIADSLRVGANTVNAAHLRAMIWAQQIQG